MIMLVHDTHPKLCENCSPWAARTRAQLDNRLRNMGVIPNATPYACPQCGSNAWAATEELIDDARTDIPSERMSPRTMSLIALAVALIVLGLVGVMS